MLTPEEQRELEMLELEELEAEYSSQQAAPVQPEPVAEPEDDTPWYGSVKGAVEDWKDFSEGIGVSAMNTYYGAKDLVGLGDEEDRETLDQWREAAGRSNWGGAGRMTGDVLQMAVPGAQGAKLATKIPQTLKHAQGLRSGTRLASDIGAAGLHGGISLPDEGQTRLENATESAGAALGGAVLGKALRVGGMGLKGTPEARRLRKQGVKLSPGRVNDVLARVEGYINLLPVGAKAVQKSRQASNDSLRQVAQKMADPLGRTFNKNPLLVKATSREINKDIGKAFNDGYRSAWGKQSVSPAFTDSAETLALKASDKLGKGKQKALFRLLQDIEGKSANKTDALLRQAVLTGKPGKIRDFNNVVREMRTRLRKDLPEENQRLLKELDSQYGKYSAVKNATTRSGAEKASGEFTMTDLLGGNAQAGHKALRAVGEGPYTQYLDDAFKAIGDEHQPLLTSSRAMIQRVPSFGTGALGRRLAGTGLGQETTRNLVEKYYPDMLRNIITGARVGAAYEE